MNASLGDIGLKLQITLNKVLRYSWLICILLVAVVYAFLAWRISVLSNIQPDPNQVSAQLKTAQVPHVDKTALKKIQDLQDNSVSVQTLFSQARNNPFQE